MTITEHGRHRLHSRLEKMMGPEDATQLMEHLPPLGWAEMATKHDMDHLGTLLRGEMQAMGAELRGEMQAMRTEMGVTTAQLRTEMADLRAELFASQRNLVFSFIGANAAIATLAVAVQQLLG